MSARVELAGWQSVGVAMGGCGCVCGAEKFLGGESEKERASVLKREIINIDEFYI